MASSPDRTAAAPPAVPRGASAIAALVAALAAIAIALYPALALGPVAEDLQWAVKGAATAGHPLGLLRPFHEHLRPAVNLFFAVAVALFGDHWTGYRALHLALALSLATIAWRALGRLAGLGPWTAAAVVVLWLASPLASEVMCATSQVLQVLLGIGLISVLVLRCGPTGRRGATIAAALLAAGSKESWVVLAPLVFLQDWWLRERSPRRAIARAAPWLGAVAGYLLVYRLVVRFQAAWFYDLDPVAVAAKLVATIGAFCHLLPVVPLGFSRLVADNRPQAALAVGLVGIWIAWVVRRRARRAGFFLAGSALLLLPTLAANLQAPRYTMLAWLFFLAAAAVTLTELEGSGRRRIWFRAAALIIAAAVLVGDWSVLRGDLADWARYDRLGERLRGETAPLRGEVRAGRALVVYRGEDEGPLKQLLRDPRGQPKLYFPRPDDPYGVMSLSALLTWQLWREGLAVERVDAIPQGMESVAFRHQLGGFQRLRPEAAEGAAGGARRAPLRLAPRPWASFDPASFP